MAKGALSFAFGASLGTIFGVALMALFISAKRRAR